MHCVIAIGGESSPQWLHGVHMTPDYTGSKAINLFFLKFYRACNITAHN